LLEDPRRPFDQTALRGQVWLLNVWASWCAPCRQELPLLLEFSRRDQVPVYGLNYKDQPDKARALLRVAGNPYVASAVDADGRTGMDFGIQGVPETFVIDGQGRVRYRHLGPVTAEVWQQKLLPVVKAVQ
jgi:cytochrome c biogenesis protein CcmG/thiol:disulfide interchange protein DsbE